MKKLFLSLLSVAMLATGCEKQETLNVVADGQEIDLTVNVAAAATRADNPDGLKYYLEAYYDSGNGLEFFKAFEDDDNTPGEFDIRLVTGQEFTLVAWADYDNGCYVIGETLEDIKVDYEVYALNDTERDAYFGQVTDMFEVTGDVINMTISRPFARINAYTLDMAELEGTQLVPTSVNVTYKAGQLFTDFNAVTGEVGESTYGEALTATVDVSDENYTEDGALLLTFDYLLAPKSDRGVVNFDLSFNAGKLYTSPIPYTLANIPYERNYLTNVYGNLFTKQGEVVITVNDTWEEDLIIIYTDADAVQTVIGQVVVGDEVTVYLRDEIKEGSDVILQFPTLSNNLVDGDLSKTVVNLVITGNVGENATLNMWNGSFRGTLNVTLEQDCPGTINANTYLGLINFYGNETTLGKLQMYAASGYAHTVGAGLTVGSLYPRQTEVNVYGTVNDFYCNNVGQFGTPYLMYGEGTDRPDMTKAEALALIDTIGTTYKYAGVRAN